MLHKVTLDVTIKTRHINGSTHFQQINHLQTRTL